MKRLFGKFQTWKLRNSMLDALLATRINRIISDYAVDWSKLDAPIKEILESLGVSFSANARKDRDMKIEEVYKIGESELKDFEEEGMSLKYRDVDLVLESWLKEKDSSLVLLCTDYFGYSRERVVPTWEIVNGRKLPTKVYYFMEFLGSPLLLYARFYGSSTEMTVCAYADHDVFFSELQRRCRENYAKKYQGKMLDNDMKEIPFEIVSRENLIYPASMTEDIDFLVNAFLRWQDSGSKVVRWGCMLFGKPGVGKTTITKLIGGLRDKGTTLMYVHASDLSNAGDISQAFSLAEVLAPTVLIFDDFEEAARAREISDSESYSTSIDTSMTKAFLEKLSGGKNPAKIYVLLTTNRPEIIDSAIRYRPGRVSQTLELKGYEECLPELISHYCTLYGIEQIPTVAEIRDYFNGGVKKSENWVNFTPDMANNVVQRVYLNSKESVTCELLYEITERVYKDFGDGR